jgi:hypothetical protein
MKKVKTIFGSVLFVALITVSCGNKQKDTNNTSNAESSLNAFPSKLIGIYHGIQPSYFMKNKKGEDMVINGNKVSVPSIDFTFTLKEDNSVSLQQINLENNSKMNYEGTTNILLNDNNSLKIECSLSDGQSNPTYTLTIKKSDKSGICNGEKEPEFKIEIVDREKMEKEYNATFQREQAIADSIMAASK